MHMKALGVVVVWLVCCVGMAQTLKPPVVHRNTKPAASVTATMSPFGIGSCYTNNRSRHDNERWVPQMEAIGLHVFRTCHIAWNAVEPEEGKWTWDALDEQMRYVSDHHIEFGGLLYGSTPWNKPGKAFGLPVDNLAGWSKYVTETVKHVRGKIKDWEIWNEPPNGTRPDQTPADYAKIVMSAYNAAKAVDPTCRIGLAAKSVHVNYLEQVIKAGAKDHFDYVVLHPYEVLGTVADGIGTESIYMNIVPTVRKMLAVQNPAKANVPIIFTELGSDSSKGASHQASALVKAYVLGIAQGVACIQWFEGMDGDSGPMGLLEGNGKPRPAYTALGQLIKHVGQHPQYLGWTMLNDRDYGFVFKGAKGTVLAAWARPGSAGLVKLTHMTNSVDPLTGNLMRSELLTLTTVPRLFVGVPDNLVAKARLNKGRPIPWGGDYSKAQSVTVNMGEKNIEKGLHTLSGEAIAKDVLAYGGGSRMGSVPGGNAFVVDPGFLTYNTGPIEITVVVRRNPANDNSGFKLTYESNDGFKNLGWYTVPDNKGWHTKTWRINDAQFNAMYGYHFSLDSDGNEYNKYYLQSVTVTKVK